jgi:predicted amidohydrolase
VESIARWEVMLRANAIVSGAYVISANRLGKEHGVAFAGHSLIIAPGGDLVLDLDQKEGLALFDLDLDLSAQAKQHYPVRMSID